jgi:hypothetical protein
LESIEKNLEKPDYYDSREQFAADVMRIFTNAREFNPPQTIYCKYAKQLEEFIKPALSKLKNTDKDREHMRQGVVAKGGDTKRNSSNNKKK